MKRIWNERITVAENETEERQRNLYALGWWDEKTNTTRIEITVRDNTPHSDGFTISEETCLIDFPSKHLAIRHLIKLVDAELQRQRYDIAVAEQPEHLGLSLVPAAFL
jgi:hypothetical protein